MASSVLVRVSGSVLSKSPVREYTFPAGTPRAGEKLTFESVNILVADTNVTAVDLPRRDGSGYFEHLGVRDLEKGEVVDLLCEVSLYKQNLETKIVGLWPDESKSYLSSAA